MRQEVDGFELSDSGRITVEDDGSLRLEPGDGNQRMLTASGPTLATLFQDLVTAEPAPREPPDFVKRILEREKKEAEEKERKRQSSTKGLNASLRPSRTVP